jgi:hypothetical protein
MDSEDIVRKFHQKRGRIRDPSSGKNPSRIQGVKKHRIRIRNTASTTVKLCNKKNLRNQVK